MANIKINTNFFLRLFIGLFFVLSALLKLQSIDAFEIYMYSFGLLNLSTAFLMARLVISVEILAGFLIIFGVYFKQVVWASILMLLGFTVFIAFLYFSDNEEHCHCFGDAVELSHLSSILKNLVLSVLLVWAYKTFDFKSKYSKIIILLSVAISIAIPFIVSPPDNFNYESYAKKASYNASALNQFLDENESLKQGKHVVTFYGTSCRFCKLASKKMTVIADKSKYPELLSCIFWGDDASIENFYETTYSTQFPYSTLEVGIFLRITDGHMPLILLLENGLVKGNYGYRDLQEEEIIQFMSEK